MGLFDMFGSRMIASDGLDRDPTDDRYFDSLPSRRSEINVTVSVARARKVPVIRDCLHTLSGSVSGLECGVFRQVDEDTVERVHNHQIATLLTNPNPRHTGTSFIYQMVDDLHSEGDFFAEKKFAHDGYTIEELWRLEPGRTQVEELPDRTKRFRHTDRWGIERVLLEDEVWHIPLPPLVDDIKGTSPILDDGKEAVAVAIALQRYANILFANDATPPYAFSMESNFKDAESKKNWLQAWSRWVSGRNRHRPAILEYGMKPQRLGLTSEEAQFLETRKELWLDLCRLFHVPPHKVGILDRATFSNIEHQSLEFVTDALRPILELIEDSVDKFLIAESDMKFEFNVESLLRGDIKTRYEAYSRGRQWGWLSVNDILRMERRNGIGPSGDRYVEPLNMVPVGTGSDQRQRDQRASIDNSISFLRESVKTPRGKRPRLELVKDAA
ncbi:phage portal protein [Celeribacter ethanolicus]|uniref:Phage portal protein n=1 Tax=Celeribacter ethanolicus TaxID=1758178 RepID=A0A291GBN3_9RHOB|nr:phage portal protein [Celeribacter ethanolicus]ATG47605.1 phage portal protein [Celeribacter ethanolicus]